jgi:hypothetical protein
MIAIIFSDEILRIRIFTKKINLLIDYDQEQICFKKNILLASGVIDAINLGCHKLWEELIPDDVRIIK